MDDNYMPRMGPTIRARAVLAMQEGHKSPSQIRAERLATFRFQAKAEARRLRRELDPVEGSFALISFIETEGARLGADAREVEALVREAEAALCAQEVGR